MKNHIAFIFLLTLLVSCSTDTKTTEKENAKNRTENTEKVTKPDLATLQQFDLKPGYAGQIQVNMPSDTLKKMVPAENLKTTERELEGQKHTAFEIRNAKTDNQLLLLAEESCENKTCKIFRVRVISPKFKTKEGIRVGSTFGEVKNAFKFSYVGIGESDFVALSEEQRMAFALDIAGFPPKPLYKIKPADIPDSTKVTSILMF
jgi:hypothetical protein